MRDSIFVALALVLAILTGCTTMRQEAPALNGSSWRLNAWSGSAMNPVPFGITAQFSAGQLAGTSGVNRYSGLYTEGPGQAFSIGRVGGTMMAGSPEAMQAEQTFLNSLEFVRTYHRAGDKLILADADGMALLTFTPGPPVTP